MKQNYQVLCDKIIQAAQKHGSKILFRIHIGHDTDDNFLIDDGRRIWIIWKGIDGFFVHGGQLYVYSRFCHM